MSHPEPVKSSRATEQNVQTEEQKSKVGSAVRKGGSTSIMGVMNLSVPGIERQNDESKELPVRQLVDLHVSFSEERLSPSDVTPMKGRNSADEISVKHGDGPNLSQIYSHSSVSNMNSTGVASKLPDALAEITGIDSEISSSPTTTEGIITQIPVSLSTVNRTVPLASEKRDTLQPTPVAEISSFIDKEILSNVSDRNSDREASDHILGTVRDDISADEDEISDIWRETFKDITNQLTESDLGTEIPTSLETARKVSFISRASFKYANRQQLLEYIEHLLDLSTVYYHLACFEKDMGIKSSLMKYHADALEVLSEMLHDVIPYSYLVSSMELSRDLARAQLSVTNSNFRHSLLHYSSLKRNDFSLHKAQARSNISYPGADAELEDALARNSTRSSSRNSFHDPFDSSQLLPHSSNIF